MLDPKLLRESPDLVRAAIAKKHLSVDLDAVLAIDKAWREQLQEVEGLRAKQKAANTEMAAVKDKKSPEFQAKLDWADAEGGHAPNKEAFILEVVNGEPTFVTRFRPEWAPPAE